jgi:uncharacterized protein YprB with RNaseH-like and TPR domain
VTVTTAPESKLARLRRTIAAATSGPESAPPAREHHADEPALKQILRVEPLDTEHGRAYVRDDWFAPDHHHGALPLSAPLSAHTETLGHLVALAAKRDPARPTHGPHPTRLAFFDIETTGLAGGSGTYVVVAGLGSFEPDGFRLRQYFLADIAHERAMLGLLADDLARFDGLVTYNGRAFDVPVLESRLAMTRVPTPCPSLAHLDLLHAVRRLFGHRMPGCRLAEAERRLLRIDRVDDIPGSLIPSLYFEYVRGQRIAPLRPVFRHNADDVLSMVGVLARVAALLSGGLLDPEDAVSVARWWERASMPDRALPLYREALPWLEGEPDWPWAAARYARLCRRAGLRDESLPLWQRLWAEGDSAAGVELAKHYEHHARDFAAAEAITLGLIQGDAKCSAPAPGCDRDALERRLARIRRKVDAAR